MYHIYFAYCMSISYGTYSMSLAYLLSILLLYSCFYTLHIHILIMFIFHACRMSFSMFLFFFRLLIMSLVYVFFIFRFYDLLHSMYYYIYFTYICTFLFYHILCICVELKLILSYHISIFVLREFLSHLSYLP